MARRVCVAWVLSVLFVSLHSAACHGDDGSGQLSVQEVRSVLESIPPYLPEREVTAEIEVFGSTSMDSMAHGWAAGFNKFHPSAEVSISAEGSETVFDRLIKNPSALGMVSRPVSAEELSRLAAGGLKQPVAVMVAREGLGVFVHESNPLASVTQDQFMNLFSSPNGAGSSQAIFWKDFGVVGEAGEKPIAVLARSKKSGTQRFLTDYLFAGRSVRDAKAAYSSNAEVVKALEQDKFAVAICGLKCGEHSLRLLGLESGGTPIPCDDHAVLLGRYPLIRPLTVVLDVGREDDKAMAVREFVEYALHQAGQSQAILAGFFPFDPPTLRGEMAKLVSAQAKP